MDDLQKKIDYYKDKLEQELTDTMNQLNVENTPRNRKAICEVYSALLNGGRLDVSFYHVIKERWNLVECVLNYIKE